MAKVCVSFVCCASASQFLAIWLGTVRLISGVIVTIVFERELSLLSRTPSRE